MSVNEEQRQPAAAAGMRPPLIAASTHDALFDDAWLKWGWAYLKSQRLYADLMAANADSHWGITTDKEFDPHSNRFSIRIKTIAAAPDNWGLILGDILHNYRSALDAAAWASVRRGTAFSAMTPGGKFNIGFPLNIDLNLNSMTTRSVEMIPGVTTADLAVFDWAQPYHVPEADRWKNYLPYLTEQNNVDKHKNIRPVVLAGSDYLTDIDDIETRDCRCVGVDVRKFNALKVDTELARIKVQPTGPDPDINVPGLVAVSVLGGFSQKPDDLLERLGIKI